LRTDTHARAARARPNVNSPYDKATNPYGTGAATCGNFDYNVTQCIDAGPYLYGYNCECVEGYSYMATAFQELRAAGDVNPVTNLEVIGCLPLNIVLYTSSLGIWVYPNVSFNATLTLSFYDSALISAKQAYAIPAGAWTNRSVTAFDATEQYMPCLGTTLDQQCLTTRVVGVVYTAVLFNASDYNTNGIFFSPVFTIPCGCSVQWLDYRTLPRPDDGRPVSFFAVQQLGQVVYSWVRACAW